MLKQMYAFFAVAILLMAGVYALSAAESTALRSGGEETPIAGEEFSASPGDTYLTDEGGVANRSYSHPQTVVVRDNAGNVVDPLHYTWDADVGELTIAENAPDIQPGDEMEIDYSYYTATPGQSLIRDVSLMPLSLGDALLWLLILATLVAALVALGKR